jgi:ABC-type multidrug transport system fused ATPase/permease subunit
LARRAVTISGLRSKAAALLGVATMVHRMAGPHRPILYLASGLSLAVAVMEAAIGVLVVPLLSSLLGGGGELAGIFQRAKELLPSGPSHEAVVSGVLLLALGFLLRQLFGAGANTLAFLAGARIVTHVRSELTTNLLAARFAFLDRLKTGTPRQIVVQEVGTINKASRALVNLAGSAVAALLVIGLLVTLSPTLSLLVLLLALLLAPLKVLYALQVHRASNAYIETKLSLMDKLNETLLGIRQIKLLFAQERFLKELQETSRLAERRFRRASVLQAWDPVLVQVSALGAVLLILLLNRLVPLVPLSQLIAYFFLLYRLLPIVDTFNDAFNLLLTLRPSLVQVARFFPLPESALEQPGPAGAPLRRVERLAVSEVSFSYGADGEVLSDVSLHAEVGELVAIVGESGSGKTTVSSLLLGMYAPDRGSITLDGVPLSQIGLRSLRGTVALMTQDVHLFNTTIREVIRGSDPRIGAEEIEQAARDAEADAFIRSFKAGYDTQVGERGVRLSGGQRQRLLLAQTYARRTPVIVLDEATSALDVTTEKRIMENLARHRAGRIILIITHRLANLASADRAYVLEAGRVVESGGFSELLARRGALWRMQQRQRRDAGADDGTAALEPDRNGAF